MAVSGGSSSDSNGVVFQCFRSCCKVQAFFLAQRLEVFLLNQLSLPTITIKVKIMIQRIQSLFLLLASGAAFGLLAAPFAFGTRGGVFADGVYNATDHVSIIVCYAVAGALSLVAIFLYKTHSVQRRLASFSAIVSLIGIALGGWVFWETQSVATAWGWGLVLPVVVVVLDLLARRYIRKDEIVIRDLNSGRLR